MVTSLLIYVQVYINEYEDTVSLITCMDRIEMDLCSYHRLSNCHCLAPTYYERPLNLVPCVINVSGYNIPTWKNFTLMDKSLKPVVLKLFFWHYHFLLNLLDLHVHPTLEIVTLYTRFPHKCSIIDTYLDVDIKLNSGQHMIPPINQLTPWPYYTLHSTQWDLLQLK